MKWYYFLPLFASVCFLLEGYLRDKAGTIANEQGQFHISKNVNVYYFFAYSLVVIGWWALIGFVLLLVR